MKRIEINLTNEQVSSLQSIEAKTRYEAMELVAKVLGVTTGQRGTWSSSRKTIIIDDTTHADITFSKGKVTKIQYYDNNHEKLYSPISIK